jgi:hypothetical protein
MENVELTSTGIKCDYCTWRDTTVSLEDIDSWIGKECPECGENLLTEEDADNMKMLLAIIKIVNNLDLPKDDNPTKYEVDTHCGITFKEIN